MAGGLLRELFFSAFKLMEKHGTLSLFNFKAQAKW